MKMEETGRKGNKGEKTKRRLFECAAQLFAQYDFDEVSVDRIVGAAGVAKGTFYIHFDSKDALVAAFLSDYVSRVDADYRATLASFPPNAPASHMLLGLIGKIADTLTDTIGCASMRTVYKLQLTGAVDMHSVMGYDRELYRIFAGLLSNGLERREFRTGLSLDALTRHFVMAIRGISYEWCIRDRDFDLKEQALTHFQLLLSGIESETAE
jgi:AcrR family transcriptional regulator